MYQRQFSREQPFILLIGDIQLGILAIILHTVVQQGGLSANDTIGKNECLLPVVRQFTIFPLRKSGKQSIIHSLFRQFSHHIIITTQISYFLIGIK